MLKFGNKEFRNLQEQVLKNMRDIADIKSSGIVLDEFGIKVVGQESSVANMPSVADYKLTNPDWAYGDAYAIGTEAPYTLYILTREDANHTADYWFDIGEFPAPGPQGPKGDTGDTGPQGQTGNTGADGAAAGFGVVSASATTLASGSDATVSVVASGPNTEKSFAFTFGIPKGESGAAPELEWGNITGSIGDQTDLVSALQAKQNLLVSGTNIKTINNESILGSGNIVIQGGGGDVTDVEVNGVSVVDQDGVAEITVPTKVSDLTNDSGFITSSALSDYATETWVGNQGYITGIDSTDVITALGYTPGTSNFSGDYDDLLDKPDLSIYAETSDLGDCAYLDENELSIAYSQITGAPTIPTKVSDLTNDSGFITGIAWGQITGTLSNQTDLNTALSGKQDTISDLSTIRDGAAAGATAVQPAAISDMATQTWVGQQGYLTSVSWSDISGKPTFATVATTGDYDDLLNKPTIPDPSQFVTLTTAQEITGAKTFKSPSVNPVLLIANAYGTGGYLQGGKSASSTQSYLSVVSEESTEYPNTASIGVKSGASQTGILNAPLVSIRGNLKPTIANYFDLGGPSAEWKDVYISGKLKDGKSAYYGLTLPNTTGWTDNKEVATTDEIPTNSDYVDLTTTQFITGQKIFTNSTDDPIEIQYQTGILKFLKTGTGSTTYYGHLDAPALLTASRTYTLPDATGTIALTSDIPSLTNYYTKTDVDEIVDNVAEDIPTNTSDLINDSGFISGITSSMVTTALGYTPIASVTPTSETWTFTLSDGTTTTKTIVTAVTSA